MQNVAPNGPGSKSKRSKSAAKVRTKPAAKAPEADRPRVLRRSEQNAVAEVIGGYRNFAPDGQRDTPTMLVNALTPWSDDQPIAAGLRLIESELEVLQHSLRAREDSAFILPGETVAYVLAGITARLGVIAEIAERVKYEGDESTLATAAE